MPDQFQVIDLDEVKGDYSWWRIIKPKRPWFDFRTLDGMVEAMEHYRKHYGSDWTFTAASSADNHLLFDCNAIRYDDEDEVEIEEDDVDV